MKRVVFWMALGAMAVVVCAGGVASAAIMDGLVSYWDFDGNLLDASGSANAHDGTYVGNTSASYAAAKFGQGIDLDGGSEHIEASDHADFDFGAGGTGMSISAWFKVNGWSGGNWQALIAKGEGSEFRLHRGNGSNNLNWSANGDTTANYNVNDGALHHVVVTHDGASSNSTKAIWIDGVMRNSVRNGGQIGDNNDHPLMIGENPHSGGRNWNGVVDDVGMWSRPLTQAEILAIWNDGDGASIGELTGGEIPEPVTLTMLAMAVAGVGGYIRRRRRA